MSDTPDSKKEQMQAIRDEVWNFKESPLYQYRIENKYHPVLGEGSHDSSIMFVGEAPGKNEAEQGRPFCGRAGNILDDLLASIDLPRSEVYITNILKDRPPKNRDPLPEEIELYAPFLDRQIEIIKPKVVATLGRFSMEYVMKRYGAGDQLKSISQIHGTTITPNSLLDSSFTIIPLYHPAVAIYNRNKMDELKKDFSILKELTS